MNIVHVSTGIILQVDILPVDELDFKLLTKARYFFSWNKEKGEEVYKLVIKGQKDILGLVSIEKIPSEWRIHIRLLTVSKENKGSVKVYEKIAGNLITHVAKIAVEEFGEKACVSLRPKTAIVNHYIKKYKMNRTGKTLSLEIPEILNLIKLYNEDE